MDVVKVRKVGNSNVVTLPKHLEGLGYGAGSEVAVEQLDDGELRLIPAKRLKELIGAAGRRVVREDAKALKILADRDRK